MLVVFDVFGMGLGKDRILFFEFLFWIIEDKGLDMIVFVVVFFLYIFYVWKRGFLIFLLFNKVVVNLSRFVEFIVDLRIFRVFLFVIGVRFVLLVVLVVKDLKFINLLVFIVIGRLIKVVDVNLVGGKRGKFKEIEFIFGWFIFFGCVDEEFLKEMLDVLSWVEVEFFKKLLEYEYNVVGLYVLFGMVFGLNGDIYVVLNLFFIIDGFVVDIYELWNILKNCLWFIGIFVIWVKLLILEF